jgi:hypothetical protein
MRFKPKPIVKNCEGYVVEVLKNSFRAVIGNGWYTGVFQIDSVPVKDRHLIQLGAYFDWGWSKNGATVRFRLKPKMTKQRFKKAEKEAARIQGVLNWH